MKNKALFRLIPVILSLFLILPICGGDGSVSSEIKAAAVVADASDGSVATDAYYSNYYATGLEENVRNYGAVGDGITDDSAAVFSALSAAEGKRSTIYFPEGIYKITEDIIFTSDCTIAFEKGAMLKSDKSVSVNTYIEAGSYQIFSGSCKHESSIKNAYCNPVWFGAAGDGVTDDTAAFIAAIESSGSVYIPYSKKGFVVGDIELNKSVNILGISSKSGKRTKLVGKEGCENLFVLAANSVYMDNFDVDMSKTDTACVFYYDTSMAARDDYSVSNIDVVGAYCVIKDAEVVDNYVTNSLVENVNCYAGRGTAFDLKCFWGFVFFRDLVIDNSDSEKLYGVKPNFPAVVIENNAGCIFEGIKIIGDGNAANTNAHGFKYVNNVATWMDGCEFKNVTGNCVRTTGSGSHLYFSNIASSGSAKDAFVFEKVSLLQIHALTVDGAAGNGIYLNSCEGAQVNDCTVDGVSGNGINILGCEGTSVVGCKVRNSGAVGIRESSTQGTAIVDCSFENNAGGDTKLANQSGVVNG